MRETKNKKYFRKKNTKRKKIVKNTKNTKRKKIVKNTKNTKNTKNNKTL